MRIRIGCDPAGQPVVIDTATRCRIALLAPPGGGKTTLCRYLIRRFATGCGQPGLVLTSRTYEYADLTLPVTDQPPTGAVTGGGLLVVDENDTLPPGTLDWAVRSAYRLVVIGAFGPEISRLAAGPHPPITRVFSLLHAPHRRPVQLRLDWPPGTVPVFCDQRRAANYPRHRWAG